MHILLCLWVGPPWYFLIPHWHALFSAILFKLHGYSFSALSRSYSSLQMSWSSCSWSFSALSPMVFPESLRCDENVLIGIDTTHAPVSVFSPDVVFFNDLHLLKRQSPVMKRENHSSMLWWGCVFGMQLGSMRVLESGNSSWLRVITSLAMTILQCFQYQVWLLFCWAGIIQLESFSYHQDMRADNTPYGYLATLIELWFTKAG